MEVPPLETAGGHSAVEAPHRNVWMSPWLDATNRLHNLLHKSDVTVARPGDGGEVLCCPNYIFHLKWPSPFLASYASLKKWADVIKNTSNFGKSGDMK
jgi:hypothetical protein